MPRWTLYVLLPIAGAFSSIVAFLAASPFTPTLDKPGVGSSDPASAYTTGTTWDIVVHVVFGALLMGSFALAVRTVEQGIRKGAVAGLIGAVLGVVIVPMANSASDLIGIWSDRTNGVRGLFGAVAWCAIVPTAVAFGLALCLGMTPQRSARATMASVTGFFACLVVQFMVGPAIAIGMAVASPSGLSGLTARSQTLRSGLPQWQAMDIAIGVTMGLLFAFAQNRFRSAWIRLSAGRREYRDWNLDSFVNRIGTQEGLEVAVRGVAGIAPVHAEIVRQSGGFLFRDVAGGAFVNGIPTSQAWLRHGDHIAIGQAQFVFGCHRGRPVPAVTPPTDGAPIVHGTAATQTHVPEPAVPKAVEHRISDGFGQVRVLPFGKSPVGRDPSNVVAVVWDERVSRFHGEFTVDADGVVYRDLGSTNGSKVNGELVSERTLQSGDVLEIGSTCFRYDSDR